LKSVRWGVAVMGTLFMLLVHVTAAEAAEVGPNGIGPRPQAKTGLMINIPARRLYYFKEGELVRSFPVGAGKAETPTPVGTHRIFAKVKHPWWQPPWGGPVVPPGPENALGTRWMEFKPTFGIHGTIYPHTVGLLSSYGCVRMHNADVEWLYERIPMGTSVAVTYEPVQIQVGADGRRYLAIYSDPYGRGGPSPASVLQAEGIAPDHVVTNGPGLYPLDANAALNGKAVPTILYQGRPYVQARQVARTFDANLEWDPLAMQVVLDGEPVPTALRGSAGYIDAAATAALLDLDYTWNPESGKASLQGIPVRVSGRLVSRSAVRVDGALLLPIRQTAEGAGVTVGWDEVRRQVQLDGQDIPFVLLGSRSYMTAEALSKHLQMTYRFIDGVARLD
jgi:L,D-transpeptidase ErfK/SrfK